MKDLKKIITTVMFMLFFDIVSAAPINNFEELMTGLKSGKEIRLVIHYKDCKLISGNRIREKSPDAIGGMKIDTWEYFAPKSIGNQKAFVATSVSKLIANPLGKGYVFNYVKVRIFEDNEVEITARYIDAQTIETTMDESFYSTIYNGETGAVKIFD